MTLETVASRYDPDLVVLVTITNDLTDNTLNFSSFGRRPRYVMDGDSLVFESTDSPAAMETFRRTNPPAPFQSWMHRRSMLYYLFNRFIYQRLVAEQLTEELAGQINALTEEEREELYRRLVIRMDRAAEEIGAELVVVFAHLRGEAMEREESYFADLTETLTRDGIDVVDLYEPLRAAEEAADASIWYRTDMHWNDAGHRVVADLLQAIIEERLSGEG